MKIDDFLGQFGLKLDDLNSAERATLMQRLEWLKTKQITLDDTKTFVAQMIQGIERELAGLETPPNWVAWLFESRRHLYLRARLRNYLMLQDFLLGPDRAEKWLKQQIEGIKPVQN